MSIVDVIPIEVRFQNVVRLQNIKSVTEWEAVFTALIATRELVDFSSFFLESLGSSQISANCLLGLQKRIRECAHFSHKLNDDERPLYIAQADTLLDLARGLMVGNPDAVGRLDAAIDESQSYLDDFSQMHRSGVLQFEEL